MVTWGVTEPTAGAVGTASTYVIGASGWRGEPSASALTHDGGGIARDDAVAGTAEALAVPAETARVGGALAAGQRRRLDGGSHCLVATHETPEASVIVTVQFEGRASAIRADGRVRLEFPSPTRVSIRVEDRTPERETVTLPPTPAGLARALTAASAVHETTGPARSDPDCRARPPAFELGDSLHVSPALERRRTETGIELTVPATLPALFVTAPLAYYLGATVRTAEGATPRLRAPDADVDHRFSALPAFQREVASLLRRVFYLDCHCRVGDDGVLSTLGLDGEALSVLSPGERLSRYLAVGDDTVDTHLPEWHLATYVRPDAEHVPSVPYLLEDLSVVYLPEASDLPEDELLDRTLSAAYRAAADVPSVDVVDPDLGDGRVHAWLAEGTPIDAYKTTPDAYRNRRRYARRSGGPLSVTVVLNDGSMRAERDTVASVYRDRAAGHPIDVTVREDLRVDELATEFSTPTDFLHYIGHCETGGLRCPDGLLSTADIERSRTRTFFLNACGSYHEGMGLVERGSLAGAVTLTAVLDEQAATVGTTYARLLTHGFSIERGMRLARRRILMGKDYAVVGDGTDALVPTPGEPAVVHLEDADDGYHVAYEPLPASDNGRRYEAPFDAESYLCGQPAERTLPAAEVQSLLERRSLPVIYDDSFHWSEDLAGCL